MNRSRRRVLTGSAATGALPWFASVGDAAAAAGARRPNILFILADDLGYADLDCYGARAYRTPVLDRLAREGARLTQAYANSAVCSATRTALITGRYQQRLPLGLEEPLPGYSQQIGLPPEHPTLPSLLKAAGYRTALVGKWHLGAPPRFGPLKSGYEHFFGFFQGAADYFSHDDKAAPGHEEPFSGLYEDDRPIRREGYLTDLLADDAARRIEAFARAPEPFLLSLHFNAPHWPWEGPHDQAHSAALKGLRDAAGGNLAKYAEMVVAMDAAIGRVLAALERTGAARDTIVVFTSDNGGERFSDMWPFTGQKGELLEGGLRVPALVRWPARVRAGSVCDQVAASMDWTPTLWAAAGVAPRPDFPPDGMDLRAQLAGAATIPRTLFWRYRANEQAAVRQGDWKYLLIGAQEHLFDVATDAHERADRKDARPEVFARLKAMHAAWAATMLPYPAKSFSETPKGRQADRY